jgi:hypothetical protein
MQLDKRHRMTALGDFPVGPLLADLGLIVDGPSSTLTSRSIFPRPDVDLTRRKTCGNSAIDWPQARR